MTRRIRSAIPIYLAALVWLIYGLLLPLYLLRHILACAALSLAAYVLGCYIFPGRTETVEVPARTGDAALDEQIATARKLLRGLREANDAIPDEHISAQLARMEAAGEKILARIAEKPDQAGQVRRFMNYYLPTAEKLMRTYGELMRVGASGEQVAETMGRVERSLDMIAAAFEKQLDSLYKDESLDIATDIEVLETMMKSDGLL